MKKKVFMFIGVVVAAILLMGATDRIISTYRLLLREAGGSNVITVQPPTLGADYTLTLPTTDGGASEVLTTDGSGVLSWASASGVAAWYVDVVITGGNPSLGTAAVSSYTEIIDAGLTATPASGSAAAGIMCSTTNAATAPSTSATTCAAGSESLGLNFTLPEAGVFEVCVYFVHHGGLDSAEGVNATFQLIETPTNAQTLTLEGGTKQQSGSSGMNIAGGVDSEYFVSNSNCSFFNWTTGTKGVRLMYEQVVSGAPDSSLVLADANASAGQRNVHFTVQRAGR